MDNITPEEKLLKLIENPPSAAVRAPGAKKMDFGLPKKQPGAPGAKLIFDKNFFKNLGLPFANKVLAAVAGIVLCLLIADFLSYGRKLGAAGAAKLTSAALDQVPVSLGYPEIDAPGLFTRSSARNIFTFYTPEPPAPAPVVEPVDISQEIVDLKMVGIIWSEKPQVMLENTKELKTYLLEAGESIGDFQVVRILRNKVVLGKNGMEWELR